MNFKKLAGDLLVVAGGVALYMLAIKPLLDKTKEDGELILQSNSKKILKIYQK
jgi:hypothetical protein